MKKIFILMTTLSVILTGCAATGTVSELSSTASDIASEPSSTASDTVSETVGTQEIIASTDITSFEVETVESALESGVVASKVDETSLLSVNAELSSINIIDESELTLTLYLYGADETSANWWPGKGLVDNLKNGVEQEPVFTDTSLVFKNPKLANKLNISHDYSLESGSDKTVQIYLTFSAEPSILESTLTEGIVFDYTPYKALNAMEIEIKGNLSAQQAMILESAEYKTIYKDSKNYEKSDLVLSDTSGINVYDDFGACNLMISLAFEGNDSQPANRRLANAIIDSNLRADEFDSKDAQTLEIMTFGKNAIKFDNKALQSCVDDFQQASMMADFDASYNFAREFDHSANAVEIVITIETTQAVIEQALSEGFTFEYTPYGAEEAMKFAVTGTIDALKLETLSTIKY